MPVPVWNSGALRIRIGGEEFAVDDLRRIGTAGRKRVADHRPLRLAEEAQHLAQVVDEAGQHHPVRLPVRAHRLRRLQQVVDLRQRDVRVGIVDQRVEVVERLPPRHFAAVEAQVVGLLRDDEIVASAARGSADRTRARCRAPARRNCGRRPSTWVAGFPRRDREPMANDTTRTAPGMMRPGRAFYFFFANSPANA